jgi:hypothetical protein
MAKITASATVFRRVVDVWRRRLQPVMATPLVQGRQAGDDIAATGQ